MQKLPNWVGPDGFPLSWHHFVYGSAYLTRATAREALELASAVRAGGATQEDYQRYRDDMTQAAR